MKKLAAIASLMLAVACTGGKIEARYTMPLVKNASTGVQVFSTIGPTCPVEGPGMKCGDKPYEADFIIVDRSTRKSIGTFRSNADGQFGVGGMKPGEYTLSSAHAEGIPFAAPVDFSVRKGETTTVRIVFDSGIR